MEASGFINQQGPSHYPEHGFRNFAQEAADVVLAVAFNSSGTRIALGAADHKIRVYDVEQDETSTLVDQWRGHDAEVMDASLPDLPEFSVLRGLSQGQMDWIDLRTCIWYHRR